MKSTVIIEENIPQTELDAVIQKYKVQNPKKLSYEKQADGRYRLEVTLNKLIEAELTSEDRLLILE